MNHQSFNFKDKVCLVTGASSGIGQQTALEFGAGGGRVIVSDLSQESSHTTLKLLQAAGYDASFIPCDVSKPEAISSLFQQIRSQWGRLDCAVNNAGVEGQTKPIADATLENWNNVIDTNLKSIWLCMKEEIPLMKMNGGGSIVNVSSIAGLIGFPGLSAYVASKHGIIGLTKTAALEYAEQNIRVNAICPGPIMTPMLERLMDGTKGMKEILIAGVPQKRIGTASEVAKSIIFMCSSQASYITGQSLAVDGGWVAQ